MMQKTSWAALALALAAANAPAQTDIDPVRLMQQVQQQASSADETVDLDMQLEDESGATSKRRATYTRKQREAGTLADMKLIRFTSPAEMNGSGVLIHENTGRADDQWLYLPAYRTSRRVPSSNRSDRYMGTDYYYEDVSNDKIEQYRYTLVDRAKVGGRNYAVIEQVPQAEEVKRESAYGKKLQWVDPERLLVGRIDYYDKAGKLFKRLEASGAVQQAGRWRWSEMSMADLRMKHRTLIKYSNRKLDTGVDASVFSVRSLERGK